MTTIEPTRAACLTPPAPGGIAIIQVVGVGADVLVSRFLRARRPLDLPHMGPSELRLCRLADGEETIDDTLVAVRRDAGGAAVVDLSLHGGPRIVQRVLLLLRQAGVRIVEPGELLDRAWPARSGIEQEALAALSRAKTRRTALWLARMQEHLPREIDRLIARIEAGEVNAARADLGTLVRSAGRARHLLEGARVALAGEPNAGKSTLANALAEQERGVVSETPGTTRDWVEHPTAIEGIPFTLVDTAGVRRANDPVEQEAVRRSREQIASADVVLWVIDVSIPPGLLDRQAGLLVGEPAGPWGIRVDLLVWNKGDRPLHPAHHGLITRAGNAGLLVSALSGSGLSQLRKKLVGAVGLAEWSEATVGLFTDRQARAARGALSALETDPPDPPAALRYLRALVESG